MKFLDLAQMEADASKLEHSSPVALSKNSSLSSDHFIKAGAIRETLLSPATMGKVKISLQHHYLC